MGLQAYDDRAGYVFNLALVCSRHAILLADLCCMMLRLGMLVPRSVFEGPTPAHALHA